jgi:hypothetical protein
MPGSAARDADWASAARACTTAGMPAGIWPPGCLRCGTAGDRGSETCQPGLLVLGVFLANAGREGFDQERVRGVYQLLSAAAGRYQGARQWLR